MAIPAHVESTREGDRPRIGFVNYRVSNCGVHQYGSNIYSALRQSEKFSFVYFGVTSLRELDELIRNTACNALVVNYHPQTLPFLDLTSAKRYSVPCVALMHEMTQEEADTMPQGLFQYYVMGDPTLVENNPRVFKTGRLVPEYRRLTPAPRELTIGSFGFSVGSKGFRRLIDVVQQEFDQAVIRLNIPANGIIDTEAREARRQAELCRRRLWKPGIKLAVTHDFLSQEELLDYLASNTLNAFLYDYLPKAGISSAVDQALAVRRPIAITRSTMFRHLFDLKPPITIENASLREIIGNGITPYEHLLINWSPEALVSRYEEILTHILQSGPRPSHQHSHSPGPGESAMTTLAMKITRAVGRRTKRYLLQPSRRALRSIQVGVPIELGIRKAKGRFNRILDDAARIEYRDVIRRLESVAPDVLAKKISRANIQQAFVFDAVEHFARQRSNPKVLCVGSFEDSAAIVLKRVGYAIEEIDPAVNGLDLNAFMRLPTTRPASYDIVFSTSVLEHVRDDENFVAHMATLLAPGGVGILTCDFKEGYKVGDPVIDGDFRFYTKRDLSERLPGFCSDCQIVDLPDWDCDKPDFELAGFQYTFASFTFRKRDQPEISADWAAMSPADQARFYNENGFLVVPGALPLDEVTHALAEIHGCGFKGTTEEIWRAPFARQLVTNRKVIDALKAIFGPQIKFFKAAYVETPPREAHVQRQALHVDYGIGEPQGDFRNSAASWVNVAFYLTDLTPEHSPLWVCAGSNRLCSVIPASNLESFQSSAKMVLAKAGDAVLFHANTVHAASHNLSSEVRHALFYSYRPAWAKPAGLVAEWPQEFVESFPIEHRAMLRDLNRGL